jgi:magnesium chelatase family protein
MDRIDIHVEVPAVKYEKLSDDRLGEPSAVVRQRVEAAREIQRRRFEGTAMACNADSAQPPFGMGPAEIRQPVPFGVFCRVDEGGRNPIKAAATPAPPRRAACGAGVAAQVQVCSSSHLSARAYHRVLKLARTIADLAGSEQIQTAHSAQPPSGIAEAIQCRPRRQA